MKHRIFLTLGIGSGAALWLLVIASGYFANPALPALGFFIPIPALLLPLTAILV